MRFMGCQQCSGLLTKHPGCLYRFKRRVRNQLPENEERLTSKDAEAICASTEAEGLRVNFLAFLEVTLRKSSEGVVRCWSRPSNRCLSCLCVNILSLYSNFPVSLSRVPKSPTCNTYGQP